MSAEKSAQARRGLGLPALLVLIFAAAKVFGFSNMAWVWVFSPIWIVLAVLLGIGLIGLLLLGLAHYIDNRN